jgi:hypothetical protein
MVTKVTVNKVEWWPGEVEPFLSVTVGLTMDETLDWPDYLEFTWDHFLGVIRGSIRPFLKQFIFKCDLPDIWQALSEVIHPECGRLFPEKHQLLTRRQLMEAYGCSLHALRQIKPITFGRGRRCHCYYDPLDPKVKKLLKVRHQDLHGDHTGYDE